MAEPTSSGGVIALASGVAGAILVALGISLPVLVWGMVGCIVGVSWAPKTGRTRALALFSASALLSAKGGAVAAVLWYSGATGTAGGIAAVLGIFFHPLLSAAVVLVPQIIAKRLA